MMKIAQALNLYGEVDSYERQEAVWLLEHILKLNAFELKMRLDKFLTESQMQEYQAALKRLSEGEPLAYVIGSQPFWTLDLKVTKDTLVPRPDTEIVVETILNDLVLPDHASVIDLGTGSGAIALSLAKEKPDWSVLATDIYMPTLEVAKENAYKHALKNVTFLCSEWYTSIPKQKFDLIVSNPPYIAESDSHLLALETEPYRALVSANNGLADLIELIHGAKSWLNPNGWIVLEHGYDQAAIVQTYCKNAKLSHVHTVKDYGGNDRVTLAQYLV